MGLKSRCKILTVYIMDNYTGPYISDGKLQSSVEFGKQPPKSALDAESRLHDSAYAHYKDLQHRMAADAIYQNRVDKLGGFAKFAGGVALYGNQTLRAGKNLLDYASYGPVGLMVGSLINDYNLFDYMNHSDWYKKEVLAYYDTDPGWYHGELEATPTEYGSMHRRFVGPDSSTPTTNVGQEEKISSPRAYDNIITERNVSSNLLPSTSVHAGEVSVMHSPDSDPVKRKRQITTQYNPYPVFYRRRGGRRRKKRRDYD